MKKIGFFLALCLALLGGYYMYRSRNTPVFQSHHSMIKLTSSAFKEGDRVPTLFTCDGKNVNPELHIEGVPENAKSLALVMEDPDASSGGTWDHWVLWNIDPKTTVIAENVAPPGAIQGKTSFGDNKYGGPCPPRGSKPHRYIFTLYALDTMLNIPQQSNKTQLQQAMEGHVIDSGALMGFFNH